MKKILFAFFVVLFGLSFLLVSRSNAKKNLNAPVHEELGIKDKLANKISYAVAMQLREEKGLVLCGLGGGAIGKIRMLALCFNCYKEVDVEEARDLLVTAGSLFLKAINENEEVRPHLINFPFEAKNIEIYISLQPKNHIATSLVSLGLIEGKLSYKIDDPKTHRFQIVHTETFEEALEKHENAHKKLSL